MSQVAIRWRNPPNAQVGGKHYEDKAIHPDTFAVYNQIDNADQFSVIKYLSRLKNRREDLGKVKDFIRRLKFFVYECGLLPATAAHGFRWVIEPCDYCEVNNIGWAESMVILKVCKFSRVHELDEALSVVDYILSQEPSEDVVETKITTTNSLSESDNNILSNLAIANHVARNRLAQCAAYLSDGEGHKDDVIDHIYQTINVLSELDAEAKVYAEKGIIKP